MLPVIAQLRAAATMFALAGPAPAPAVAFAELAVEPVEVSLHDENLQVSAQVAILPDGTVDPTTAKELRHLFRSRDSGWEKSLAKRTLAMLADVQRHYPGKTIDFVSVYRSGDKYGSPHLDGRAIDFRIKGVSLVGLRDYLWKTFADVGVGWYPNEQFIHLDTRPNEHDCAWTFYNGAEHYHPYWAELARQKPVPHKEHRPGV